MNEPPNLRSVLFLGGPTGSGKTEVSLVLAEKAKAEIISVDSMQVYRGMDIGTAKPGPAARRRVPHHLLDVAELDEPFDPARFAHLAKAAILDIQSRGKFPLLCGGTGLYFRALLEGLGAAPPSDPKLRAQLEATPIPELLQELAARDPATYHRIDKQNPRRIFRAVEVIRLTGKPFSEQRAAWGAADLPRAFFVLDRSQQDLRNRINTRVDDMFQRGLLDETRELLQRGLAENRIALQALGYRQVVEYLQGRRSLEATVELVKLRTRQYARRQLTWFRRQPGVRWVHVEPHEPAEAVAQRIFDALAL